MGIGKPGINEKKSGNSCNIGSLMIWHLVVGLLLVFVGLVSSEVIQQCAANEQQFPF